MNRTYGPSRQWLDIGEKQITRDAIGDLSDFKSSGVNHKLALWDPRTNGVRYLKTLIHELASGLSPDNWGRLRRTAHRDFGNPITVRYEGESICLDYLQSVLELEFISGHVDLDGAHVLEIGAGYGRLCHTVMSNHDVASYSILDLESTLEVSRGYLAEVLDEATAAKVTFLSAERFEGPADLPAFDLCVNIDSFTEMDPAVVDSYLALIDVRSGHFYTKNPVGKYLEKALDDHSQGEEVVRLALETGPLRDVLDIHDTDQVRAHAKRFVEAYRPGTDWECVADGWARPWSFFWQALYRRELAPTGTGSGRRSVDTPVPDMAAPTDEGGNR